MRSLRQHVLRWWGSGTVPDRTAPLSREQLLALCYLMVGVNSLAFYFVPQPGYDHHANLALAALLLGLLPWTLSRRWHFYMVNVGMGAILALIVYVATVTGGIHSPALVFLTVMAGPALFFLGPRGAGIWLGVLWVVYLVLLVATLGLDLPRLQPTVATVVWALFNHAIAAASLMWVLGWYDRSHRTQLRLVQERNQELESTQRDLLQSQTHKDDFVAAIGHELRTPMNAILGLNGVLRQELSDDPAHLEAVDHIRHATERLLRVVNDILDFAQLQAGRVIFYPQACVFAPWLASTVQPYKARAEAKGLAWQVRLAPELPPEMVVDAQRVGQILGYLLENAIKFTASGQISLTIGPQGEAVRFEVQDTGRGVAPERHQHIFNRFESADVATQQAYGGTGLGLSICERLVVLQGGRMGGESAVGQGALFWFELPLQSGSSAATLAQTAPLNLGRESVLDVLVVDDNAMNLMVAQLQLRKAWPHVRVTTASAGRQAMALMQSQHFDVALIDMVMPEMDGLQLTQWLRQAAAPLRDLPVIALTANTNPVDRQRCLDAGMNQVLYKPMDPEQMVRTLSEVLTAQGWAP